MTLQKAYIMLEMSFRMEWGSGQLSGRSNQC